MGTPPSVTGSDLDLKNRHMIKKKRQTVLTDIPDSWTLALVCSRIPEAKLTNVSISAPENSRHIFDGHAPLNLPLPV